METAGPDHAFVRGCSRAALETISRRAIRVYYLAEVEKPKTMHMRFSMDAVVDA